MILPQFMLLSAFCICEQLPIAVKPVAQIIFLWSAALEFEADRNLIIMVVRIS